jgi:phosphoglycolate phosphatase
VTGPHQGQHLAQVLSTTGPILLDFDGPVTALMAGGINEGIASAMREVLSAKGVELPESIQTTRDPLAVLRFAGSTQPAATLGTVETACREGEIQAARTCEPTQGAHDAMRACMATGRPVVIVSNNDGEAIAAYLARFDLQSLVLATVARPQGRPDLMKPHPALVQKALDILSAQPERCAFIGDSVTDIEVSRATRVRSIGYAKSPQRRDELASAGADAVVESMTALTETLRSTPRLPN